MNSATSLLLLHGFMGCARDWQPVVAQLSPSLRSEAVDLPWHGENRNWHPDSWRAMIAEAASRWLPAESRQHLCGYSMGGRVALGLAAAFPERVASLFLLSASPGLPGEAQPAMRRQQDAATATQIASQPLPAFIEQWYRSPLFSGIAAEPLRYRHMIQRRLENDPAALALALQVAGTGAMPDYRPWLRTTVMPMQYLHGGSDPAYCAIARELLSLNPAIRISEIPGVTHALLEEAPAAVAKILNEAMF